MTSAGEALAALRARDPEARACWWLDLDAFGARVGRLRRAFEGVPVRVAYALKANALPALLERAAREGLDADAGSVGELVAAERAGFGAAARHLSGAGRTPEEARWAAQRGVRVVSADHAGELDLLQREAHAAHTRVRVALRVNPGIAADTHAHIATGHADAKFGIEPGEAIELFAARERWPRLDIDGVHVHVGSQMLTTAALERGVEAALAVVDAAAGRGAELSLVDVGGGFGIDYASGADVFPLEAFAARLAERARARSLEWVVEPGRWLVGPVGRLIAEVLWIKRRGGRRFVVLAAGMNDLLRPALYGARHRITPVAPRAGALEPAIVVGPVCESSDTFATDALLPPIEAGDLVAIEDAGAYGAVMSSNYNGRGRLAELVLEDGVLRRVRAAESAEQMADRRCDDVLGLPSGRGPSPRPTPRA